jgi:hypothetical protein
LKPEVVEDKQGVKRHVTEVVGEEIILLDKKI